ncbi:MAG TPA: DMT family transporter [Rhodobacteraceae bacterium]|nr:DMT family transporter [Paracoccaceae bacterium]
MPERAHNPTAGILWMLLTGALFVAVIGIVKHLGSALPAAESAFLRYALGLVFLLPMIGPILRARLSRRDIGLFAARGLAHTLGVFLWFFAMTRIPMAEVTAVGYLSPVFVTIGAALFLGERLAARRLLAIGAALAGAMVILRPGFREISSGHLAILANGVLFGASYLIAKLMSGRVGPAVVVGMLSITVTIGLAPLAAAVWITPTAEQLGWIFLVACFATAGHYTMTLAFQVAPITVTQPVTFLQLVWSTLLGAVLFSEPVDGWVIFGGAIIIAAISFITWREAVLKRQYITPAPPATKL